MVRPPWHPPQPSSQEVVGALGYNQELGLCIEFGPVRDDSVHWGGACAGSRRHGLLPGLLVIACYLSFTPSSLKW